MLWEIDYPENMMKRVKANLGKIINGFGNLGIRVKLLILFTLLSVLPTVLIGVISYSKSSSAVETKTNRYSLQILEQTSENINQMLKSYEMICYNIAKNTEIVGAINKADENFDIDSTLMVRNYLQNIIISRRDEIASIFLYSSGGRQFHEGDVLATAILNYSKSGIFRNTKSSGGKIVWTTSSEDSEVFRSKGFLTVSKLLKDPITQKDEGSVLIFLKEKTIEDMYNKFLLEKGGVIFVLDKEGRVISHPNKDLLGKQMSGFKDSIVLTSENGCFKRGYGQNCKLVSFWTLNKSKGWKIVSEIPYNSLMSETYDIRNTSVFIVLACMLLSVICSYFISAKLSKPIINIADGISNVDKEYSGEIIDGLDENMNLINIDNALQVIKSVEDRTLKNILSNAADSSNPDSPKSNEVDKIGKSVTSMARKIRTLTEEVYKQKLLKREAELKSLQTQINPHFLYNVLEKIKGIAELEGSRKSAEMIAILGKLFRLNLSKGKEIVTIKQEIEHMNLYLSLQTLGGKNKYQVDVDIEEGIEECVIIKMTLQPIIENAIIHGLEKMTGRNEITVKGYKSGNDIFITVHDNGQGIDNDTLDRINSAISHSNHGEIISRTGSGIALRNVSERIQLYFGKNYGLNIASEQNLGTSVTIKIPMITYDEWGDKHEASNR